MLRSLIIAVAVIALLFGVWTQINTSPAQPQHLEIASGTVFPEARDFEDFQLIDANNKPFSKNNLNGQWNLVFFGFTNCPMICPTTLSDLNKTYQKLQEKNPDNLPQVVLISVDPERDTPEKMKEYLLSFNKQFTGATGDNATIQKLTRQLGVIYAKMNQEESDNYDIDHSGAILVINPQGQWQALLTAPHDPNTMADDIITIMKQKG